MTMATPKTIARDKALLRGMLDSITAPKRVVGLDLSTTRPGFAIVYDTGESHTEHMNVAPLDPNVYGLRHADRLASVVQQAIRLCKGSAIPANLVCIEAPFTGKGNYDGMGLSYVFEVLMHLYGLDIPIVKVTTTQLKKFACGTTKDVDKAVVALAARDRLGWKGTVNDESDALFLAHYGWALLGRPLVELPKSHMATIEAHLGVATSKAAVA